VVTWHGSLQHEVLHGHPFSRRALNDALGSAPLSLWLPYQVYRRTHLRHHRAVELTDPVDDTESFYLTAEEWSSLSCVGRALHLANRTLLGRLTIGPVLGTWRFWRSELKRVRAGDRRAARAWMVHLVGVGAVAVFALGVCGLPAWIYLLGAVYGARSLGLVRSFCEHRWVADDSTRSAVVRSGQLFSVLFLYNNLHHTHHARPALAWYRLPATAIELGSDEKAAAGAGWYRGYFDVARRYLVPPITHQTKVKERKQILERINSGEYTVVVTSQVLNEGVDVPSASVGIVLSGSGTTRENVQRLGRILRKYKDKQAVLYEVVARGTAEEFTSERRRQHGAFQ